MRYRYRVIRSYFRRNPGVRHRNPVVGSLANGLAANGLAVGVAAIVHRLANGL